MTLPERPHAIGLPSLWDRQHWDPIIAACDETDSVISLHVGSSGNYPAPPGCADAAAVRDVVQPAGAQRLCRVAVVGLRRVAPKLEDCDERGRHRLGRHAAGPARLHRRPVRLRPRLGRAARRRAPAELLVLHARRSVGDRDPSAHRRREHHGRGRLSARGHDVAGYPGGDPQGLGPCARRRAAGGVLRERCPCCTATRSLPSSSRANRQAPRRAAGETEPSGAVRTGGHATGRRGGRGIRRDRRRRRLQRGGIHTFTIYESSLGIGGTWWDNTYPGAEVDVGSHLYCFSFKPHDWSRTHARQPELQKYLEETVDEFGLRSHLQLGVTVESAAWDDAATSGRSGSTTGRSTKCHVLVSGVGFLNVPRYPSWPGLEDFGGPVFHTARWEHQHDLTDKVMAVVGTGSSATQIVPAIQPLVRQLYVFQREPGWIMPKGERDFSDEEQARVAHEAVEASARALAAQVAAREEPARRRPLPARHETQRGAPTVPASPTSVASSPTIPSSARP